MVTTDLALGRITRVRATTGTVEGKERARLESGTLTSTSPSKRGGKVVQRTGWFKRRKLTVFLATSTLIIRQLLPGEIDDFYLERSTTST